MRIVRAPLAHAFLDSAVRVTSFGTVLQAPVPERSALVKNKASLVSYISVRAP